MSDEFDDDFDDEIAEASLTVALQEQLGAAPWYLSSVAIHCLVFLVMLLIPVPVEPEEQPPVVLETEMIEEEVIEEEEEEEEEPEIEEQEIETEVEVEVDTPVVETTEVEIAENFETEDEMDESTALGDPDSFSDVDAEFSGTPALMGVGSSGGSGGGGRFGFRNGGGRKRAVRKGGGSRKTETAVDWALKWLAEHQESDGHWDCVKYGGAYNNEAAKTSYDVGVTGLALLAFLGAGNSSKSGKYKRNVKKAMEWMSRRFNGKFFAPTRYRGQEDTDVSIMYEAAIAAMAMSEAYGMAPEPTLKSQVQKHIDNLVSWQRVHYSWGYSIDDSPRNRCDTSVTGWCVMGLKSGKVAGLNVPKKTMKNALKYFHAASKVPGPRGPASILYSHPSDHAGGGTGPQSVDEVPEGDDDFILPAVAMTCLQFLGEDRKDEEVIAFADASLMNIRMEGDQSLFYNWYYQALGFFQMGIRSKYWKTFLPVISMKVPDMQVKVGTFKENKGSWNPEGDRNGKDWGRVGQTAIGALMLEVFYRYKEVH